MRKTILVAAVTMAFMTLFLGCESIPQESAPGGILSGTETQRHRNSVQQDPILAGNGPQVVGQTSAAANPSPSASMTPMPTNHTASPPPSSALPQ